MLFAPRRARRQSGQRGSLRVAPGSPVPLLQLSVWLDGERSEAGGERARLNDARALAVGGCGANTLTAGSYTWYVGRAADRGATDALALLGKRPFVVGSGRPPRPRLEGRVPTAPT